MARIRNNYLANSKNKWVIGIYIRLSREDKNKIEKCSQNNKMSIYSEKVISSSSNSVIEQYKILMEWVAEYFQKEDYEIFDYFVDDGLTGTDDLRDDFQRLMNCVDSGNVNCIVVKTLSRAFRNYADQGRYLEEVFPAKAVRFISTGNPFSDSFCNPEEISNGMEIPINGLMNDRFAAKTSADIRRTLNAKRKRGEFIGAFAPYGYLKNPKDKNSLIIDEVAAQNVRNIYKWYVIGGMSKRGIAQKLNQLSILNPTSYKIHVQKLNYKNPNMDKNDGLWSSFNVTNILKNEMYIGNMIQGQQRVVSYKVHKQIKTAQDEWFVVPNTHEAIIKKSLFEKAQALHSRDTRTAPNKKEVYLFSGLLRCSDCKKALRRKTSKNYTYYYCRTHIDKGFCKSRSIREDKLQQAVLESIRIQIDFIHNLNDLVNTIQKQPVNNKQRNHLDYMLGLHRADYDKIKRVSEGLYLDWKIGNITKEEYDSMKKSFVEKAANLKLVIEKIKEEKNVFVEKRSNGDSFLSDFLANRNITELNRGIVVNLINMIYVHESGRITIDFAFSDEMQNIISGFYCS